MANEIAYLKVETERERRQKMQEDADELLALNSANIWKQIITLALHGDPASMKMCADRTRPAPKTGVTQFYAPKLESVDDIPDYMAALLRARSGGCIDESEFVTYMKALEAYRHALETTTLTDRIAALEASAKQPPASHNPFAHKATAADDKPADWSGLN